MCVYGGIAIPPYTHIHHYVYIKSLPGIPNHVDRDSVLLDEDTHLSSICRVRSSYLQIYNRCCPVNNGTSGIILSHRIHFKQSHWHSMPTRGTNLDII